MKASTFISKYPVTAITGGAVIEDTTTGQPAYIFLSGESAGKFWAKAYKRNPNLSMAKTKARLFDYLAEKKVLRDAWSA
jgi:hypothetical protein